MTESNTDSLQELWPIEHTADPNGPPAPDAQLTDVDRLLLFRMAQAEFSLRVERITNDDWDRPTPCADWTVAHLVRHLITEHRGVPPLFAGDDATDGDVTDGDVTDGDVTDGDATDGDATAADKAADSDAATDGAAEVGADEDLITAWLEAAKASSDSFGADGALAVQVALPQGATPAAEFLADLTGELAIHGWDLSRAVGELGQLPDALARPVWERFREHGDLSGSGLFGPPVPVDAGASYTDRLVGQAGRDRYWAASPR